MDVGQIRGPGGVDRGGERSARGERAKAQEGARGVPADALSISDESRRAAKAVEELAERAKDAGGDRAAQVAAARA
ncbi:MAG: hypothetical protein IT458_15820, partial [Planctomycetes bacterium]|nr:hypothetical protein [Planctomycetota bacterium]